MSFNFKELEQYPRAANAVNFLKRVVTAVDDRRPLLRPPVRHYGQITSRLPEGLPGLKGIRWIHLSLLRDPTDIEDLDAYCADIMGSARIQGILPMFVPVLGMCIGHSWYTREVDNFFQPHGNGLAASLSGLIEERYPSITHLCFVQDEDESVTVRIIDALREFYAAAFLHRFAVEMGCAPVLPVGYEELLLNYIPVGFAKDNLVILCH